MALIKGAILEKGEEYFSNMNKVLAAIKGEQINYNWLITDYEFLTSDPKLLSRLTDTFIWLTGEELSSFVTEEYCQWVWAVFSAFPRNIGLEEALKYDLPSADGYDGFWNNPLTIQHPLAEIEITAWDSSSLMIISRNEKIINEFRAFFPNSTDLAAYNSQNQLA